MPTRLLELSNMEVEVNKDTHKIFQIMKPLEQTYDTLSEDQRRNNFVLAPLPGTASSAEVIIQELHKVREELRTRLEVQDEKIESQDKKIVTQDKKIVTQEKLLEMYGNEFKDLYKTRCFIALRELVKQVKRTPEVRKLIKSNKKLVEEIRTTRNDLGHVDPFHPSIIEDWKRGKEYHCMEQKFVDFGEQLYPAFTQ